MLLDTWELEADMVVHSGSRSSWRICEFKASVLYTMSSKLASLHSEILFPKEKEISK